MHLVSPPSSSPETLVRLLVELLDVEEIDTDLYRGNNQPGIGGRVFGGQVIAQALQAAQRSTDPARAAHSLHGYFMRPGDPDLPILYSVERDFEGRSFANRRVVASQRGEPILNLAASFHVPEDGVRHQQAIPALPGPDGFPSDDALRLAALDTAPQHTRETLGRPSPIEIRALDGWTWTQPGPREPRLSGWMRLVAPIGDDATLHRAILAYASDIILFNTALAPYAASWLTPHVRTASLDHALWLHEAFRADEWILYDFDSPWAGNARGFTQGRFYSHDGRHIASVAQEGMLRIPTA